MGGAAVEGGEAFAIGDGRSDETLESMSAIWSTVLRYTERVLARV
jgi:hypothetical protein